MAEKNPKAAIQSLIKELATVKNDVVIGNVSFKELTYEQQRKIISNNSSVSEMPATISNVLNEFIKQNVEFTDDVVKSDTITVDVKPFVLNVLRSISVGKSIELDGKSYQLYDVQPEDLVSNLKPEVFTKDTFQLVINVPTIRKDIIYNALLINALSQYKNKQIRTISEAEAGSITELYMFYENMKYIESFTIDGTTYDFIELTTADKVSLLNQFPQQLLSVIKRYRKQVDKCQTKAFTVTSMDDGSTQEIEHAAELFMSDDTEEL